MDGEKRQRLADIAANLQAERQKLYAELTVAMQREKETHLLRLDDEIARLRDERAREVGRFADEEVRRMEERMDQRYRELAKKKEEWLEFESRRRMAEMRESIEREAESEKEKLLQARLA